MDIIRRATEDAQHVESVAKKALTTRKKIVPTKSNAQTAQRTIPSF